MKQLFLLVIFLPLVSLCQHSNQFGGRAMDRLESYKKIKMLELLKLDEEKGLKLVNRYSEHRESVKNMERKRMEVIAKLEKQMLSNVADGEYQKTFIELEDVEKKMVGLRSQYLIELKDILSYKQIAEYMIFERNFARDVRDIARDFQKNRMRRDR